MCGSHYPTWHSLTCEYLAVMASLVASEHTFSSAGITICKHCNWLDGDIVEALQCLKSFIQQDLMVRVFLSIADEEILLDDTDNQPANQEGSTSEAVREAEDWTWEDILEEVGGNNDVDNIAEIGAF